MAERKKVSSIPKKASEQPVNEPDQQSEQASAQQSEALAASSRGNPPATASSTSQVAPSAENHRATTSSAFKQQAPEEMPVLSVVRLGSGASAAASDEMLPPSSQTIKAPDKNQQGSEAVKQGSGGIGATSGENAAGRAPGSGGGTSSLAKAAASARNPSPQAENPPENAGGGEGNAMTGKVTSFNWISGYGFIAPSDGSEKIFVHQSKIRTESWFRGLKKGQKLEFTVAPGLREDDRRRALNVTRLQCRAGQGGSGDQQGESARSSSAASARNAAPPELPKLPQPGNGENPGPGSSQAGKSPAVELPPKAQIVAPKPPAASSASSQPENPPGNAGNLKTGVVNWFDPARGYGFIIPSDRSRNVFVHQTSILCDCFRTLQKGEPVEFEVGADLTGQLGAINVRSRAEEAKSSERAGNGVRCNNCNRPEHFACECVGEARCYRCDRWGHVGRDCYGCFHCGGLRHFARNCPNQGY